MGKIVEPRGQIKAETCSTDVFLSDYRKTDRTVTPQTLKTLSRRDKRNSGEGGQGVYLYHVSAKTWSRERDSLLSISKKIRQRGN